MVIFIDETIFEKQKFGGISRYFCELSQAIEECSEHVVVIYGGWSQNAYLDASKGTAKFNVIQVGRILRTLEFAKGWLNPLLRKFYFLKTKLEYRHQKIIYHPSYFRLDSVIAKYSELSMLSVYDLIYENRSGKKRLKKIEQRKLLQNKVDQIIAISKSTARDLSIFNPQVQGKISVIHLASIPPVGSNSQTDREPKDTFLFVGSRGGYKNGRLAIEAFARLQGGARRRFKLLFVGGGSFRGGELTLIADYGLEGQIEQQDMSDSELVDAYRDAIALVYPSSYEGFGLPLLEAMQVNCPVIAQDISSMPEVLGKWGHYMDNGSCDALLAEMQRVLLPQDESISLDREALRKHQLSKFSWRKTAEETIQAYERGLLVNSGDSL